MAGGILTWIKRRKITVLMLIVTFIVSGLLVNLVQLPTLPLYWLNRRLYRQLNAKIVYFHWCILPWALESWAEYDIRIYGDEEKVIPFLNTEHALVVLNHRGDLDWMIGWVLINRAGLLGGVKAIMKDIAKYMPGIGWSFMFMEYPLLKRDWNQDKARLEVACRNLADYPVNMLLCLFAEGTRFTPEKHKASMEFAKKNNLPTFRHHLFPRTKGFCFLINNLKDSLGAVYDVTTCYRGPNEPSIVGVVNAESSAADICIRRFPMSEIPCGSDKELSDWLIERFKEKDELVEYHNKHKEFPVALTVYEKRSWANVIVLMWICLCSIPLLVYCFYQVWTGEWIMVMIIGTAIIMADQLFQKIASNTQISKTSSSYGLKPKCNGEGVTPTNGDGGTPTNGDGGTPTNGEGGTPTNGDGGTPTNGDTHDTNCSGSNTSSLNSGKKDN